MTAIQQIFVVALGLLVAVGLLTWIGSVFDLPTFLPNEITIAIDYIFSLIETMDFALPLSTIFKILKYELAIQFGLMFIDGGIFVYSTLKKWHS